MSRHSSGRAKLTQRPSPGSDDDRRWFRQNPDRNHRVRRALLDEAPDNAGPGWVIVRQVAPGLRMRAVVDLDTDRPVDDEANARQLFERLLECPEMRLIHAQVERMAHGPR